MGVSNKEMDEKVGARMEKMDARGEQMNAKMEKMDEKWTQEWRK